MRRISKEVLKKINLQRKMMGITQAQLSLKMEKSRQFLTKVKQDDRDLKVDDLFKAAEALCINPCYLLPDDILESLNHVDIGTAIKVLASKGYRIILEESERKESKGDDKG